MSKNVIEQTAYSMRADANALDSYISNLKYYVSPTDEDFLYVKQELLKVKEKLLSLADIVDELPYR